MTFAEDTSTFFATNEFAVTATLNSVSVQGIFDEAYAPGTVGPYGMAGTSPVLTVATTNIPANPVGLSAVIRGSTYLVSAHEPDGTGISRLILEKNA